MRAAHRYTAWELEPQWSDLFVDRGLAYSGLERFGEAIADGKMAIAFDPYSWRNFYYLGIDLAKSGKTDDAVAIYRRAKLLAPAEPEVQQNLGAELCNHGRYQEAIPVFEDLLRLQPQWIMARPCLARSYEMLGQLDRAKEVKSDWEKYR